MNKSQLIDALAARLGDRRTAASAVDGLLSTIVETVKAGESVSLTGFGVFEARARAARVGRNPRTGQTVAVPAATVPAFRPGTGFKTAVGGASAPPSAARTRVAAAATPAPAEPAAKASQAKPAKATKGAKAAKAAKGAKAGAAKTAAAKTAAPKTATAKASAKEAKAPAAKKGKKDTKAATARKKAKK